MFHHTLCSKFIGSNCSFFKYERYHKFYLVQLQCNWVPIIYAQYLYWYWYLKVMYWCWYWYLKVGYWYLYWYLDHWYWYWYWYLFVVYLIQDWYVTTPCEALTWNVNFWCAGTYSEYLGQVHMSRSSGQGQGHRIHVSTTVAYPDT